MTFPLPIFFISWILISKPALSRAEPASIFSAAYLLNRPILFSMSASPAFSLLLSSTAFSRVTLEISTCFTSFSPKALRATNISFYTTSRLCTPLCPISSIQAFTSSKPSFSDELSFFCGF